MSYVVFCLAAVIWLLIACYPAQSKPSNTEAALNTWAESCKPDSLRWGAMVNGETQERAFVVVCPPGGGQ